MIIDNLTNLTKYVALNRSFQTVIDYLKANDLKSMEPGHYPIDGDNIFVNIQEGFGKTKDENPTIRILLCKDKSEQMVELTLPKDSNIYASKYELYLPDKKLLQEKLKEWFDEETKIEGN